MIVFIILAVFFTLILFLSYLAYLKAYHNRRKKKKDKSVLPDSEQYKASKELTDLLIREMEAIPFERVTIEARDGTLLAARYYHVADGVPLHIQCHGYRGAATHDFCGGNKLARDLGHNTLVIDQRAHGESGGHTISFGIKERFDCIDWVKYAIQRFGKDVEIILSGVSMGASTVLMAAGENLPSNVVGIIADSPYSSPKEIILKVCGDIGLPPKLSYPFALLGARIFGGFNLTETNAIDAASRSITPILLIHGEADKFVPCEMSNRIASACSSKITFETFPDAGHVLSFVVAPDRYVKLVKNFIKEVCKE